jgi:hypothetical protein
MFDLRPLAHSKTFFAKRLVPSEGIEPPSATYRVAALSLSYLGREVLWYRGKVNDRLNVRLHRLRFDRLREGGARCNAAPSQRAAGAECVKGGLRPPFLFKIAVRTLPTHQSAEQQVLAHPTSTNQTHSRRSTTRPSVRSVLQSSSSSPRSCSRITGSPDFRSIATQHRCDCGSSTVEGLICRQPELT